jgi:hypothetical protein
MRYGFKRILGLAAVAALSVATAARADAPDTSTPTKAAVAFAKAVQAGDMATAKALSTGTASQYALLAKIGELSVAMKKLEDAAVKKFGAEAKPPKEMSMDMAADFETAEVKLDGDKATLVVKSKPDDKFPPTLKKDGDNWKVDLTNLENPEAAAMAPMIPVMVKVLDTVTKNINDGKYKTAVEVYTDFGAQISAALVPADPAK